MPDEEALNRRLRAVERSLTDGDHEVDALREAGVRTERIESLESRLADAEDRIAELEAVTQALRGYVGNVRSVNEDVEQRADAALAAVDRLEERIDGSTRSPPAARRSNLRQSATAGDHEQSPDQRGRTGEPGPDEESEDGGIVARVRDVL